MLSSADFKVFGKVWDGTSQVGIYTELRQNPSNEIRFLYEGNTYLYVISEHNNTNVWQGIGFNLSVNKIRKGQQFTIKMPFYWLTGHQNNAGIYVEIKNHKTGSILWNTRIDTIDIHGDTWDVRAYQFTANRDFETSDYSFWIYAVQNGGFCISTPYMCEGNKFYSKYSPAPEDVHLQNSRIESSITQVKNEIRLAVTENNFGTVLTQNATSLRLAWNNISNYVQFENAGMSFYEGTVTKNNLRARIDDGTYSFWRDGYQVGSMGTGVARTEPDKKGLSFFLDKDGTYMAWSYRNDNNLDNAYTFKWMYTRQGFNGYEADTLNAGCTVNFGWNVIKNFKFHSGAIDVKDGITGRFNVKTDFGEETLIFKNGLLVSGR